MYESWPLWDTSGESVYSKSVDLKQHKPESPKMQITGSHT